MIPLGFPAASVSQLGSSGTLWTAVLGLMPFTHTHALFPACLFEASFSFLGSISFGPKAYPSSVIFDTTFSCITLARFSIFLFSFDPRITPLQLPPIAEIFGILGLPPSQTSVANTWRNPEGTIRQLVIGLVPDIWKEADQPLCHTNRTRSGLLYRAAVSTHGFS